jgi:hypothetical protein
MENYSSYLRLNKFLNIAKKEHEGHTLNCGPSFPDVRDYKLNKILTCASTPVEVDYRSIMPDVFDQGTRGSCVACAATRTVKEYQEVKQGDNPANGLSPAFLYSICKQLDGSATTEGTTLKIAMQALQKYGVCTEDLMPYSELSSLIEPNVPTPTTKQLSEALLYKIKNYAQICSVLDTDRSSLLSTMRTALQTIGPFAIALLVCSNFKPDANYNIPLPEGSIEGGHAIGIVGDQPSKSRFIIRNSWGKTWGLNGYAYLPYEWITAKNVDIGWYLYEAWTSVDVPFKTQAKQIKITLGSSTMDVDGVSEKLDQPAEADATTGRTLIPVRSMAENMGYTISWGATTRTIILTLSTLS